MRTFIAADLTQDILQKINKIMQYFEAQAPPGAIKWVDTHNLHLTIKFLGDIKEEILPSVKDLIHETLEGFSPFSISVETLGMFPNQNRPRVIWLGIHGGEPLRKIHYALEGALTKAGVKREDRDFHPHLTLGRVRRHVSRDQINEIGKTFSQFKVDSLGTVKISEIHLYQSELTRQGPIYTSLYTVPLHQV